ncbi:MAG: protoheme IX farnesyltransferase [Gammaproteobacteria bacterium]|jgi:protoheme IX farnesyltransferase|nr:protoheme IX farnesyltransferase [Gammaproteobacteria bacterium]MBT3725996.1 protoheme IX farnesyltransferase [Gammaproteobacteria bacterium]MBT4075127.1 protoheme IX farnesyltransferase [Gammaproteobacteria bacterium]MBT4195269.1 protoheme IX farnesyltransferase [Gammaproteobacteria bacterium]MBT4448612.1 protoheme IX farnesyltransferase [Gammaproteobacteria bacterium]
MNKIKAKTDFLPHIGEYYQLCKPKVVYLILFTALAGMLLSTPGMVSIDILFFGLIGIGLGAASGAAINHWVDRRIDIIMARTKNRPLPQGNISSKSALIFAISLGVLSMVILFAFVNTMTAILTFISLVGYAVVYTMFLKHSTPHNIVLGGAAGAAPPVLGWVAVTNELTVDALLLFLIIFIWTPPHFWALAIKRRDEYKKAGVPMLPVTHGIAFTKLHIVLYTLMLLGISMLPFVTQMSGYLYLAGSLGLGLGFLYYAVKLYQCKADEYAMKTFGYSIFYLSALFALLISDHYLREVIRAYI